MAGSEDGYIFDHRHLLPLLRDVRFNQALLRSAGDRNASRGGNDDGVSHAESILDLAQDSRTSRLLPAIDRASHCDSNDCIWNRSTYVISTLAERAALCELRRTEDLHRASDGYRISLWAETKRMDGHARRICSSAQ